MQLAPRPGLKYRDTRTKALVPETGFTADPTDLDIARALACGDLVKVPEPAAKSRGSTQNAAEAVAKETGR